MNAFVYSNVYCECEWTSVSFYNHIRDVFGEMVRSETWNLVQVI